jgi:glycosyltransferase involved in cell wall biosynthesis
MSGLSSMAKKVLLINQPYCDSQNRVLDRLRQLPWKFYGLDRGDYIQEWNIELAGRVPFKMATRSPLAVLQFIGEVRKLGIREGIMFFDNETMAGRELLKVAVLIAGIRLTGVASGGSEKRITGFKTLLLSLPLQVARSMDLELSCRVWLYGRILLGFKPAESKTNRSGGAKKILLAGLGNYGGIETLLLEMFKNFDRRKFQCDFLVLDNYGVLAKKLEESGFNVYTVGTERGRCGFVRSLVKFLTGKEYDIIHYNGNHIESIPVIAAAEIAGIRSKIFHMHGTSCGNSLGFWNKKRLAGFAKKHTTKYIAVSDQVKDFHIEKYGYDRTKAVVVVNGVPLPDTGIDTLSARSLLGIEASAFTIGVIGRISFEKGLNVLVDALSRIDDIKCVVCGDGPQEGEIKAQVSSYGLEGRFIFLGRRDDTDNIYAAIDMLILPSMTEGLPVVMLEAMARNVPVLASAVGGIPGVITDGENGFLVPAGSSEALAEKIAFLSKQPVLLREVAANAYDVVSSKFSSRRMCNEIEKIYEEL